MGHSVVNTSPASLVNELGWTEENGIMKNVKYIKESKFYINEIMNTQLSTVCTV